MIYRSTANNFLIFENDEWIWQSPDLDCYTSNSYIALPTSDSAHSFFFIFPPNTTISRTSNGDAFNVASWKTSNSHLIVLDGFYRELPDFKDFLD